jgi:CheY-like chemotaxis protein
LTTNGRTETLPHQPGLKAQPGCRNALPESLHVPGILLVEDEHFVRQAAAEALRSAGYRVLTAKNGNEALELCRRCGQAVDLLLADVVMPGMNGCELAEKFRMLNSRGCVLLMSGYAAEVPRIGSRRSCEPELDKPFSVEALLVAVEKAIGRAR